MTDRKRYSQDDDETTAFETELANALEDMVAGLVPDAGPPLSKDHARYILARFSTDEFANEVFPPDPPRGADTGANIRPLFK